MAGIAPRESKLITLDKVGRGRLSEPGAMIAHLGNEANIITDPEVLDELSKLITKFPSVAGDDVVVVDRSNQSSSSSSSSSASSSPNRSRSLSNSSESQGDIHPRDVSSPSSSSSSSPSSSVGGGGYGFMKSVTSATSSLKSWVFSKK
jgi:hypothetical protein